MQVPHSPAPEIQQFQDRIESTGGQSGLCGRCQKATSDWFRIIRTPADSVMQSGKEKMIMKCEKCGYEMENHSTAQTVCMECPHCGWGFAATMPRPLDEDMTDYKIYLNPGNAETMENIKLISAVCHVNYLEARKLLSSQEPVLIYKAEQEAASPLSKAEKVMQTAKSLKECSLVFSIIPAFPYEIT